jgi:hypothetical protein
MNHIVLTSCTNRKRTKATVRLTAQDLSRKPLAEVAADWGCRLREAVERVQAVRLYCGRSFREAERASTNGSLFIVSAGLGIISAETEVPSYSLTISNGSEDNVLRRVVDAAQPSDWWTHVQRHSPFGRTLAAIASGRSDLMLIALPAPYLKMIDSELEGLPRNARRRLRIFTRLEPIAVAAGLRAQIMPYDARLDGEGSEVPGTQGDFAQRAARHFVEHVLHAAPRASAEQHHQGVETLLRFLKPPRAHRRKRLSDEAIARIIRRRWRSQDGSATRMAPPPLS